LQGTYTILSRASESTFFERVPQPVVHSQNTFTHKIPSRVHCANLHSKVSLCAVSLCAAKACSHLLVRQEKRLALARPQLRAPHAVHPVPGQRLLLLRACTHTHANPHTCMRTCKVGMGGISALHTLRGARASLTEIGPLSAAERAAWMSPTISRARSPVERSRAYGE
jgi:hypothetical protein